MAKEESYDMGATEAPTNSEKEFIQPGYRKLTVKSFEYTPEENGKTPLVKMKAEGKSESGETVEFTERFYISGKLNKDNVMSSVVRVQELYKGLTGNPKIITQFSKYNYIYKKDDGTKTKFTIPNPKELCDYLNKTCVGKTAVFRVGGEENENGKVFSKLSYSGFLYYTDKQGALCRYTDEGEFTDKERKFLVQKKKGEAAPAHAAGLATTADLDAL